MKRIRLFFISLFLVAGVSAIAGPPTYEAQPLPTPTDENHRELFDYELDYTGNSSFFDDHGKFGNGDSLYNDFSYAHRFLITGKWYFRAGVEYERFDFDGTNNVITPERKLQVHNAVVQYSEDKAGVQVTYSGLKPFDITLGGGVTVRRDFDFFRAEASAKTDPAPFVKFEVKAKF